MSEVITDHKVPRKRSRFTKTDIIGAIFFSIIVLVMLAMMTIFVIQGMNQKKEADARDKDIAIVQQIVKTQHPEAYLADDANDTSSNTYLKVNRNHYVIQTRFGTIDKTCDIFLAEKTMTCRGGIPEVTVKE